MAVLRSAMHSQNWAGPKGVTLFPPLGSSSSPYSCMDSSMRSLWHILVQDDVIQPASGSDAAPISISFGLTRIDAAHHACFPPGWALPNGLLSLCSLAALRHMVFHRPLSTAAARSRSVSAQTAEVGCCSALREPCWLRSVAFLEPRHDAAVSAEMELPMAEVNLDGGCLCGYVRYHIAAESTAILYCHCRMCQRAAGAPVVAWFTIPASGLKWLTTKPRVYKSSDAAARHFCPACGSQIAFQADAEPELVDITVASLDRPAAIVPSYHCWTASQIPWFDTDDTLPRYRHASNEASATQEPA